MNFHRGHLNRLPNRQLKNKGRSNTLKGSQRIRSGPNSLKFSEPCPLMKAYWKTLNLARSVTLDGIFKSCEKVPHTCHGRGGGRRAGRVSSSRGTPGSRWTGAPAADSFTRSCTFFFYCTALYSLTYVWRTEAEGLLQVYNALCTRYKALYIHYVLPCSM